MDLITRLSKHLGVDLERIQNCREENGYVIAVVDYGVQGGKKVRIPMDKLETPNTAPTTGVRRGPAKRGKK